MTGTFHQVDYAYHKKSFLNSARYCGTVEPRRLSCGRAGAQVRQVGPPHRPSRASLTCRPSVHRCTPNWRLVFCARRTSPRVFSLPTTNLLRTFLEFPPLSVRVRRRVAVESSVVGRGCGRERRGAGLEEAVGTLFPQPLGCVSYATPCSCCPPLFLQHPLPLPLPIPLPIAFPIQSLDPVAKHQRLLLSNMVSENFPRNFRRDEVV
ncbi:unnamed protein product [Leptosia nina]|uniref:Uncharacterized protein n=1 Tax=Leptosia nina TaxID=320188 RepID=A0AAV1JVF8_9NEOP